MMNKEGEEETFLDIPIGMLLRAERSIQDKLTYCLEIALKYGPSFRVKYLDNDISAKTQKLIVHMIETANQLAFQYGQKVPLALKCQLFCPARCEEVKEAYWYDNQGWKKLPNYP